MRVLVTVRSERRYEDGTAERTESTAAGTLEATADGFRLEYGERAEAGLADVRTALDIRPGRITLTRSGALRSRMCFEEGTTHESPYETSYGTIPLGITTRSLRAAFSARGGTAEIDYALTLARQDAGTNRLSLAVQAAEDAGKTNQEDTKDGKTQ